MKLISIGKSACKPFGVALSATAIAALTLTACGSDNNATGTSSSAAGSSSAASAECGGKNALTGEGSTAQQNAIAEFNKVWSQVCSGKNLSYNPTGSGAGVDQFIAKQVNFAGSDSAMKDEEAEKAKEVCGDQGAFHVPAYVSPIAIAYNLPSVKEDIKMDAETVAKVFAGEIKKWNDPAVAALNAGQLAPVPQPQVVGPLERGRAQAEGADRPMQREPDPQRDDGQVVGADRPRQHRRDRQARTRDVVPDPPEPSPPGGLLERDDDVTDPSVLPQPAVARPGPLEDRHGRPRADRTVPLGSEPAVPRGVYPRPE